MEKKYTINDDKQNMVAEPTVASDSLGMMKEQAVDCIMHIQNEHTIKYVLDILKRKELQESLYKRICEIGALVDNWDGYGAKAPSDAVVGNALNFLDTLVSADMDGLLDNDSITPTAWGTIVMDLNTGDGLVSVEIGSDKLGYFTDFANHKNSFSEGLITDFLSIPEELKGVMAVC